MEHCANRQAVRSAAMAADDGAWPLSQLMI
jgi:hypothetical protein